MHTTVMLHEGSTDCFKAFGVGGAGLDHKGLLSAKAGQFKKKFHPHRLEELDAIVEGL